ncbi:MAG TPA: endonuclease/exonuclease/phosphatase family protein [Pseudonocardiaceae bacterium]|jgi:endonuclease/exonuclease/phosphatase (EEP) superfamily protein YafD|nr:endonuclease/exonuclease/phosphatase family protein [Pseudonocardiaceae bacterium]
MAEFVVLLVLAALFVGFAGLRLLGIEGSRFTASVLALTPYATVVGLLLGVLSLVLGQWWIGGVELAAALGLAARVLPRVVRSSRPARAGQRVRVLSSNIYLGRGDVKTLVELVREHEVDVLNVLELTEQAIEELDRAGMFELLPHRILQPARGGGGSGLLSRHPLTELALPGKSLLKQPSARIDLGERVIEVVAVHPIPPTTSATTWRAELAGLPAPVADGPVRVLAGDFNATLDHAAFRRLLRLGYQDAAACRGLGLRPTWPGAAFPPPVTLDHVLVDRRAVVTACRIFDVPGSDHRAVYAELVV